MTIFFTIIHVLVCSFLILVILLQQGRGGGMGAAFGGASQQVFGGAGAGNFLTRLTEGAAFTFMFTSILLAGLASQRGPSKYEEAAKAVYGGTAASAPTTSASSPTPPPPPAPVPTPAPAPLTPEPSGSVEWNTPPPVTPSAAPSSSAK